MREKCDNTSVREKKNPLLKLVACPHHQNERCKKAGAEPVASQKSDAQQPAATEAKHDAPTDAKSDAAHDVGKNMNDWAQSLAHSMQLKPMTKETQDEQKLGH